ncbi:MAG TPA: hypothetical protein VK727_00690 [Steroidobacteraceae bacterium]|nr:hypothetical protein [Steroidobacteraceae bacterium]
MAIWLSAVLAMLGIVSLSGCTPPPPKDPALVIDLRWVRNYPAERKSNVNTGLYWALSFLGAKLPASANILNWHGQVVTVDLGAAQVQPQSIAAWKKLLQILKSSDEYRKTGAIDIGRFVFLSLCSANHYYELTGTSQTFAQFLARHRFGPRQIAVVESAVAHGNRLIDVGTGSGFGAIAFVAYEGHGALKDSSFHKQDVETLEFMPNGQLHFGLYDLSGHLKTAATPELTKAGKPSKCLWCHEINLNPPFQNVTDLPGYYSTQQFRDLVASEMRTVASYRQTLRSKVDFRKTQDHTNAENLYMSFAQPTAERLAAEWNMPVDTVRQMLRARNLKPHPHSAEADDGILGDQLYDRTEVDALAPYTSVRGPTDFREASSYEPDLLQ